MQKWCCRKKSDSTCFYTNFRLKYGTEHSGFFSLEKLRVASAGLGPVMADAERRHCANDMV